jgi:hypothetical protein
MIQKTEYAVFWVDSTNTGPAHVNRFGAMGEALALMQILRDNGHRFVTMASENVDNVGLMGVSSIVDGKCPDGSEFQGRTSRYGVALARSKKEIS